MDTLTLPSLSHWLFPPPGCASSNVTLSLLRVCSITIDGLVDCVSAGRGAGPESLPAVGYVCLWPLWSMAVVAEWRLERTGVGSPSPPPPLTGKDSEGTGSDKERQLKCLAGAAGRLGSPLGLLDGDALPCGDPALLKAPNRGPLSGACSWGPVSRGWEVSASTAGLGAPWKSHSVLSLFSFFPGGLVIGPRGNMAASVSFSSICHRAFIVTKLSNLRSPSVSTGEGTISTSHTTEEGFALMRGGMKGHSVDPLLPFLALPCVDGASYEE